MKPEIKETLIATKKERLLELAKDFVSYYDFADYMGTLNAAIRNIVNDDPGSWELEQVKHLTAISDFICQACETTKANF